MSETAKKLRACALLHDESPTGVALAAALREAADEIDALEAGARDRTLQLDRLGRAFDAQVAHGQQVELETIDRCIAAVDAATCRGTVPSNVWEPVYAALAALKADPPAAHGATERT